ncbi:MAG: hypothetical protein NTV34_10165 [Proteobacteria bacterium]|nr:hypothetical protein [Pseudomonadota bacterium]
MTSFMTIATLVSALGLSSCGQVGLRKSSLKDEVDPTGEHDHHFFGQVVIRGPGSRKFPDAVESEIIVRFNKHADQFTYVRASTSKVPNLGVKAFDAFPLKGRDVCSEVRYSNTWLELGCFTPTEQRFRNTINLKRIDVNDMLITRENGTSYRKPGTYTAYYKSAHNVYSSDDYLGQKTHSTGTGVDVPEGFIYIIKVTATSEEGSVLTDSQEFDFR